LNEIAPPRQLLHRYALFTLADSNVCSNRRFENATDWLDASGESVFRIMTGPAKVE
jgi:hypothetical protein